MDRQSVGLRRVHLGATMGYQATVLQVMIASPSDIRLERDHVRTAIHEWNAINSKEKGQVLLPVAWDTHASPEMGKRGQEVINERLVEDCDLLVAVFWTRAGTPTGDFVSGSIEEVQRHVTSGKPAMVYFSRAPVAPEFLDRDQYDALIKFKEWCKERGLVEEYDSPEIFYRTFARHLSFAIPRHFPTDRGPSLIVDVDPVATHGARLRQELRALSQKGQALIQALSETNDGMLLVLESFDGLSIQAGSQTVFSQQPGNARAEAGWRKALDELVVMGFIEDLGRGEVFRMTARGFEAADELKGGFLGTGQ
jgi:hypothetical protein